VQVKWKSCGGLIRTTSSTRFTRPTTFGSRHHSLPYIILCISMWGLHPNVIFFGSPRWKSQNWDSYCPKTLDVRIFFKSSMFQTCKGNVL
jgi:hypothetical protein